MTYYDLRQDHTSGALTPAPEPSCDPAVTPLCPIGNPFSELRQLEGEMLTNPMAVFNAYINDATLTVRRHTLDIIGSEGAPESNALSLAVPSFSHFRVSRYEYGIIPPGTDVQQAQFNAPNLPMFVQGTAPFMGDYIDVAGAPSMVPDSSRSGDGWKFNTSPTTNPVFHATWTDNRDVLPPPDGISWNKYTPPISASIGPTSKFDPTKTPPACVSGYSGMRNQNIYTSAISHGLILTSPQTAKPVLQTNGQPIPREFALIMRNDTNASRAFQLTIPAQPASSQASFLQFGLQTTLTVNIPALSSASRPVFLTPNPGSTVSFPSFQVNALETDGAQPPLTASILFNSDPTNPLLADPDNAAFGAGSISSQEFYNPAILNPAILNPAILNPAILNPAILNPAILNPAILNPAILNPAILNPNFVVALNPAILNPAILNPAILNNAVANPAILNPAILNTPVSDANYTITNEGNTSATYQLQLFQSGALPASAVFQIILTKTYLTPGVSPTDGCTYGGQVNNEVIASIDNPAFVTDPTKLGNPAILNSAINNPTFSMAPGDTVQITLRANLTVSDFATLVLPNLTPVVAAQAVNTVDVAKGITTPPISLLISTTTLPTAVTGQPYSAALAALGGNPPLSSDTWSLIGGSLPPGLNLSTAGVVSGAATSTGTFPFVVEVADTGTPQHMASRQLSITVVSPVAITTPSPALPEGATGTTYTMAFAANGGVPPYTWTSTGTLPPGLTLGQNGILSGTPTAGGTFSFTIKASDMLGLVSSMPYTVVITSAAPVGAQMQFITQPTTGTAGQPISPAIRVQILNAAGAALPGVTVTLGAGGSPNRPILSGTLSAVTDTSGAATFSNAIVDRAGAGFTLVATAAEVSSSGAVQLIPAPPSVQQGALKSDTQIQLFSERRGVSLANGVAVDITSPGSYTSTASLTSGTIPAATLVDSYYLHADPVGISQNIVQKQAGAVTFPTPVLGVIVLDPELAGSDAALGGSGTLYPATGRELDLGSPTDTAILSADSRTLTLRLSNSGGTDDVRVITAANPNSNFGQITSAPFSALPGTGFIATVAGSTWKFPTTAFSPLNAPLGLGADLIGGTTGIVADSLGNVYLADPDNHIVFKISDGTLSIVAGTGVEGYSGDGGPATAARLDFPDGLAFSPTGELYIADSNNSVIRKVDATGKVTTVVGNGLAGYAGDGGQAVNASLNVPGGITFDAAGDLLIADSFNGVIRKVDTSGVITTLPITTHPANTGLSCPTDVAEGTASILYIADSCAEEVFKLDSGGNLTIVAGNGSSGYSGDGGPAISASLSNPSAIKFDSARNLYIADEYNNVIRKVNIAGIITTAVGTGGVGFSGDGGPGPLATLAQPGALAFDPLGNLYIGDTTNERIRKVDLSGTITTIAGNGKFKYVGDGGPATSASLDSPTGNTVDPFGNLFAADIANQVVRKIDPAGLISTYAGTGLVAPSYSGDGGPATSAPMLFPNGVKADGAGNIYVTEGGRVHKINPSGIITTLAGGPSNSTLFNGFTSTGIFSSIRLGLDSQGNVYIASNNRVLKLDSMGALSVVAGSSTGASGFSGDGGPATLALLRIVRDVAADLAGNLYIADSANGRVRRVDPNGIITTVAGNGSGTASGDGGPATSAGVPGPFALAVDGAGNLFIGSAGRVRKVDANGTIGTIAGGGFIGPTVDGIPATNAAFTNVQGLAFDAAGNLYLTDRFNDRVRKITGVTTAPPFIFNPPAGLTVSTKGLPRGDVGSPYFQTLSAVGGATPYTWSIVSGALPAGLGLSNTGAISGTPTASGAFTFAVQVADSTGVTATQSFTVMLNSHLAITTTSLPGGTVGVAYSQALTATGGAGGYIWTQASGTFPPDLTLSSTGVLSGTPTTPGTYPFSVTVTDSLGLSTTAPYSITIGTSVAPPASAVFVTPLQNSIEGQVLTGSPVQVRVTDATNTPLPNATVSIGLNGIPPCASATLGGTLTQITDGTGTATFADLTVNRGQFGFALAAAAGNVIGVSNAFNIEGFCDTGSLATARALHSSVTLPNGMVLIAGGSPSFSNRAVAFASAELYNPVTHTFTAAGSMHVGRSAFSMTLLQNGLVLVAGGLNGTAAVSSAELFDPSTNNFTLLSNSMVTARVDHIATLLANGKVLITGGNSNGTELASAEIFDPTTNTFTATSQSMTTARDLHQAVLLPNGKVFITGGFATSGANNALASAELYDPVADTFTATGSMATPRYEHASALLFTGKVLVGGGFSGNGFTTPLVAAEIYDPSTGTFGPTTNAPRALVGFLSSVPVLADGTVFLQDSVDAQIYDPTAGTFRLTGNTTTLQAQPLTALMADGTVLVTGGVGSDGNTGVANAEIFYPINVVPISITTVLPTALLNVPYNQQLQEKGGVGALTWTVASGTLPTGLTLSPSGLLSGTPTAIGASIFSVQVKDSGTPPRTTSTNFVVAVVPPLTIIPILPTANPSIAYNQPLVVGGGATPYTFAITSGSLPARLTLSNGVVSGTTIALGTFTFTVKVTDSSTPPVTATQAVSITVAAPLTIVTTTLPGGQVGTPYSATITASGGSGTIVFGLASGTLPTGLTLTPQGVLSGPPNTASSFTFTLAAVDSSAEPQIAEQTYTVVIAPAVTPVSLGPASLPAATLGAAYSQNFAVSGGTPPYTVTQTGTLPPGLTFNGAANPPSIAGTPTSLGTFGNIVVTAKDSLGAQAQITYSIIVNAFSASCGTGNESLFNGQYAVLMQGFDANGPRTLLGSIAPNGAGGFISGQLDIGTDLPAGGGAAQHLTIIPAQSSFSVGADRRGCMVLTTSAGSSSYRFVLSTVNNGLSNGGRIIDFQQNGAYGAGFFTLQDAAFLAAASLNGSYAFIFSTPSSLANIGHWAMLGSFAASGGAVSSGSWDYNDTHSIDGGSAWATSGLSFPANETYAFEITGRGTLLLPSVQQYSQSNTLVSTNIVVYPIDASEMYAAVLPDANNKPLVGDIQRQITPFSSLTLNGSGFVDGASAAPIFSGAWVGLFSASQNAWSLSLDNDFADIYSTSVSTGTYAVDSTGRAPLAFTGSASPAPMLHVIGPNKAYFMLADSTSAVGVVHGFSGGVPPSSIAGSYVLGPTEGTMDRKVTNLVGTVVFDAAGNVTFTEDQATGSTNTLTPGAVFTSTYSYNASTGRGVIPPTGTPHFVFDANQSGVIYLLDVTSVDPEVEQLEAFAVPAVTLVPDPLNLVVGTNGTMDVFLSSPATGNGQVVTLASTDSTIASVPASVTVLAGTQGLGFQVTTGANAGSAVISASIPGSPAANASVVVSPLTMTVSPDSPLLAVNRSFNATVTLVQPAGAGGVTVSLSAAPTGIVTISPASQTIAAGQSTAAFTLTAGSSGGSTVLTATAPGYVNATAPLTITTNLISFGTIPVLGPGQSASLPVSLSFAAPTGGLTINFASSNAAVATVTPSVFVPAGLLIPSANPQVTGVTIGSTQINATATGFAPDTANVTVTVAGALSPSPISVNATRIANVTLTISAAVPAGGITFNLTSDNTSIATVPTTATVPAGQLTVTFPVTGVAQGTANLSVSSTGIATVTATINVSAAPIINVGDLIVGHNTIIQGNLSLSAAAPPPPATPTLTLTSSDPTHFLLTADPAKVGTASITLSLTPGSPTVPAFYIEGQNYSGTTAITATLTASSSGYSNGTATLTLYPTGLTYWPGNNGAINTTTFSSPSILTIYLVLLSPGTLNAYTYGYPLGPQAPGAVPVSLTNTNTTVGALTGNPATIGVGTYFTQAISFVPATVGTANLNLATPTGYFTPANVAVQAVATVTAPTITVNAPIVGNNLIAPGSISLGAPPPSSPANPTVTLTSSDPTHFLLTADPAKVGTASITLPLTPGSTGVPTFYIEGQNYSGTTAITATLTASSSGYANGTATLTLYPTGLTYWPGSNGTINTSTFSPPSILTIYLVLLSPGTLNAYTYGYSLGPQAPGAVPVSMTDTNTTVGTITGNPASIGVGAYFTQAISFVPANAGTTNLNLATPTGYFKPADVPVQSVATVTAPAINLNAPVIGNNLVEAGGASLGAPPPSTPANPTLTLTSSDPTHFLLTADPAKVGSVSLSLPLTPGSASVPTFYIEGQNFSGTAAITATLTASSPGYTNGTVTMTLYPSGVTYWPGSSSTINTTTFSSPTVLTVYLALLSPGTLNAYTYGYSLGPQAGGAVPVSLTDTNTAVGSLTGNPATIGVGTYFTQAISFVPATAGTTNLNLATPTGFFKPADVPVQSVVTVTSPAISLSAPIIGNNLIEPGSVGLGAAPPSNEMLTLTSSDPTHFLLSTDATKVGANQIKVPLTAGSLNIPPFYVEGQNFGGAGAVTATLTASAAGYSDGTFTLTLYPTGVSYWPGSGGTLNTTATSSPSVLTVYLVLLSPGTLNAYTYGYPLGPQAPGVVPVSVSSTNTTVGTVTGGPASITAGTYYTQALNFVPATTGTTNLNLATPTGYFKPADVAVQIVVTVQ